MKKAFDFVLSLKPAFFDLFGYPYFKFDEDNVEVYFDTDKSIRDLECLDLVGFDEFRMFSQTAGCPIGSSKLTVVFTFYNIY